MTVNAFGAWDIAQEIMFNGLLSPDAALRYHDNTRRDMMLALAGAMPGKFVRWEDDFIVDTINLDQYLLAKDTNATDFAVAVAQGGTIAGSTGTNNSVDGHSLLGPAVWSGDKDVFAIARLKIDVVTAFKWEFGLLDAVSDGTLGGATDIDVPSNQFGDGAIITQETAETITAARLLTEGSNSQTIAATPLAYPWATDGISTDVSFTPTAGEYFHAMIAINGDDAHAMIFDDDMNPVRYAYKLSGLEGATGLAVWAFCGTSNATAKVMTIDRLFAMQNR